MSWSTVDRNKLAVSTNDNFIYILHDADDGNGFKKIGELTGHQSGVTYVSWSGQSEHKLVSASIDHTVRVWDTQTMECIAWSEYENKMHCAAFLPTGKSTIKRRKFSYKSSRYSEIYSPILVLHLDVFQMKILSCVQAYRKLCISLKFNSGSWPILEHLKIKRKRNR